MDKQQSSQPKSSIDAKSTIEPKSSTDRSESREKHKKKGLDKYKMRSALSSNVAPSLPHLPSHITTLPSEQTTVRAEPSNQTVKIVRRTGSHERKLQHLKQKAAKMPTFRFVMPKPDCIVIDLLGTIVTKKFMSTSKDIRAFAKKHLHDYLDDNWRKKPLRVILNYFRGSQASCPDNLKLGEKQDMSKEEQIELAKKHILHRMKTQPDSPAVGIFMLGITEWGYTKKLLVTPIYEEVHETLKSWSETHKFPVYVAVGSADFLLMVLTATTSGNLIPFFKGHMNLTDFDGNKVNKDFKKLIGLVKMPPGRILYLTRFRSDARKAIENGLMSMIVLRHDFDTNNLISAVHKWRARNPNLTTASKPETKPKGITKLTPPMSQIEEKSFIKKLGTALGLEAIVGGGPTWEIQKNILITASEDMDASKLRASNDEQSMHHRSSHLLEEDLDYYKVILALDELEFT